jgi:hypothetical protein
MSETVHETPGGSGPAHRTVEVSVAVAVACLGLMSIAGSLRVGVGWGAEGPRAGFFPFYVGLLVVISAAINLVSALLDRSRGRLFSNWRQLRQVLAVVIPTAVYVTIVPYLGIYTASALLIAAFMKWMSKYRWWVILLVAVGMPIVTFLMFERWFLVPLPKGPVEEFLGF